MKDKDTTPPPEKSSKTPQWIRDVAVGAKNNDKALPKKESPSLVSTDQYDSKENIRQKQNSSPKFSEPGFYPDDKLNKTRQRLLEIEELKQKDKENELMAEKKVEEEDKRIEEIFNNHFQK